MNFEWLINKNKEKFYPITHSDGVIVDDGKLTDVLNNKQDKLVNGTNIKTINGNNILGEGNIEIKNNITEERVQEMIDASVGEILGGKS